ASALGVYRRVVDEGPWTDAALADAVVGPSSEQALQALVEGPGVDENTRLGLESNLLRLRAVIGDSSAERIDGLLANCASLRDATRAKGFFFAELSLLMIEAELQRRRGRSDEASNTWELLEMLVERAGAPLAYCNLLLQSAVAAAKLGNLTAASMRL